jgi:hypothetical protein
MGRRAARDTRGGAKADPSHAFAFRRDATEVTGVAGQGFVGFDDEALRSAGDAMRITLGLVGEEARTQLVALFRELVPVPTVAAFRSAHAARWAGYGT